jgi:4'-phosphopantetheinyl transferase
MTTAREAEVLVWRSALAELGSRYRSLLSGAEHERLERFRRLGDRRRFALGAALLRLAVARMTDVAPEAVGVDRTCDVCGRQHGRPIVAGGPHVSVSHSQDVVAVACTWAAQVGLDIEAIPADESGLDFLEMVVSPGDALVACAHAALVTWTMKEAYLKATGTGLRTSPDTVALVGHGQLACVVTAPDGMPVPAWVRGLTISPGYLAAACVLDHEHVRIQLEDATPWFGRVL